MEEKIYLNVCEQSRCKGPVHVVEKGDTLYSIARMHHTRVRVLLKLNPFVDVYNLQPGEEICIPPENTPENLEFTPYVVREGDTIGTVLNKFAASFEELAKVNKVLLEQKLPAGIVLLLPKSV